MFVEKLLAHTPCLPLNLAVSPLLQPWFPTIVAIGLPVGDLERIRKWKLILSTLGTSGLYCEEDKHLVLMNWTTHGLLMIIWMDKPYLHTVVWLYDSNHKQEFVGFSQASGFLLSEAPYGSVFCSCPQVQLVWSIEKKTWPFSRSQCSSPYHFKAIEVSVDSLPVMMGGDGEVCRVYHFRLTNLGWFQRKIPGFV